MDLYPPRETDIASRIAADKYRQAIDHARDRKRDITMIDVGTGPKGFGRICLENCLDSTANDSLYLYDPFASIRRPAKEQVQIANTIPKGIQFDVINMSYAVCCMHEFDSTLLLSALANRHKEAQLFILHYNKTIDEEPTVAEKRCEATVGKKEYLRRHSQWNKERLKSTLIQTGWGPESVESIGPNRFFIQAKNIT